MVRARRGGILVIVALALTVLAGFVALVFDIGYMRMEGARLQMAGDAVAHAAAKELDRTEDGLTAAMAAASAVAGTWTIAGAPLSVDTDDIQFGTYDGAGNFVTETDPALINALRVNATADLPLFFSAIAFDSLGTVAAGRETLVTTEEGGGAYATDCVLPIAVPLCEISSTVQNKIFDAGRYAEQYGGSTVYQTPRAIPYTFWSETVFQSVLDDCTARGEVEVDDTLRVSMANNDVSYDDIIYKINNESNGTWDTSKWGTAPGRLPNSGLSTTTVSKTLEGPIPVIDDPAYCDSTLETTLQPNNTADVVGFIWGAIYDVSRKNGVCGASTPQNCERVRFRVDINEDRYEGTQSGGPDYGVLSTGNSRFLDADY